MSNTTNTIFKVRQKVMYRFNKNCKWKEGRIWQIDHTRTLPYAVEYYTEKIIHGKPFKGWTREVYRINEQNLKSI